MKILAILALSSFVNFAAQAETISGPAKVVDGDTFDVGTERIRLHGIDTPEPAQPFGTEATLSLAGLVKGKTVSCEVKERDSFGRLIAVCVAGHEILNDAMVRLGLAWAFRKYSDAYVSLEQVAKAARRGIWQGQPEAPWDFRERRWRSAVQVAPDGCPIKGNVTQKGERVYHAPWSPWYDKTRIDGAKGERWFCSEGDAVAAGWRAPYWH